MKQVTDFFKGLFDSHLWPARWHCGSWSDFHGWLYIVSDLMVWLAYFLMPVIILHFTRKKSGLKFHGVYLLFAAFILLCGTTHFLDALMFWVPVYRFNALIRLITGIVSMFTVYQLIKILPDAFSQRTNTELETEIARRIEAEQSLADANKGLETFAYIASHDLQEPLRKIKTYSSLLSDLNADNLDDKSKEYVDKIHQSSARMQKLIRDVLTLSETSNKIELKPMHVQGALERAKEDLEIVLLESGAVINYQEIPPIMGNEAYLSQLFMNLISNAIKFSTQSPFIHIKGERKGDTVLVHIADNGIGMEQKDTEKIFEAFSRLHSRSEFEGSGIGLAISKKIVDMHQGKITVQSKIGEGTIFTIEFLAATV